MEVNKKGLIILPSPPSLVIFPSPSLPGYSSPHLIHYYPDNVSWYQEYGSSRLHIIQKTELADCDPLLG